MARIPDRWMATRPSAPLIHGSSVDRLVATSFGTMAVQALADGQSGLMMALRDGRYRTVPVDTCIAGTKRVDVARLYDAEAYKPAIKYVLDSPKLL